LVVRYRDLFEDLPATLVAIARHLGLPDPTDQAVAVISAGLDPTLRHHEREPDPSLESPLMAIADAVWSDGAIDLEFLPPLIADAWARGWLRPPVDGELLARARAEVVDLRETVRKRNRQLAEFRGDPKRA
jgi:hypothetical protein